MVRTTPTRRGPMTNRRRRRRRPQERRNMDRNGSMQKLRAASCSVLLLLLTLALVASSLLVARYAVQASSWWLSLLAVTVCLLGLCTWIQLAASRASRWRVLLARQVALSRARSARANARALGHDHGLNHIAHISSGSLDLECDLDDQQMTPYRVPGPPPPPPYGLSDLPRMPPSYSSASTMVSPSSSSTAHAAYAAHLAGPEVTPTPPVPGLDSPPPYAVAIKRDRLIQSASATASSTASSTASTATPVEPAPSPEPPRSSGSIIRSDVAIRRPFLWF